MISNLQKSIAIIGLFFSYSLVYAGDGYLDKLNLRPYIKTSNHFTIQGQIKNNSGTSITSYKIGWKLNNGTNNITTLYSIGGGGLTAGNSYVSFFHPTTMFITTPGNHVVKVWIQATGDTNLSNDTITYNFKALGVGSYVDKTNLFEQSSGTWCQYCPAAATTAASIKALPRTAVAVFHKNDIYEIAEGETYFDSYYSGTIFSPGAVFNQGESGSYLINAQSGSWLSEMNSKANSITPAQIVLDPTFDVVTRQLDVDLTVKFKYVEDGDYYMNLYIVENGIVGTQVNAPNPYTHNNVVRKMLGGTSGTSGVIPTTPVLNTDYTNSYSFIIPTNWNINNLSLIGIVFRKEGLNKNTFNAVNYSFSQILSASDEIFESSSFVVFPNPAQDNLTVNYIYFGIGDSVSILNINGQSLLSQNLNSETTDLNISNLPEGVYLIKIKTVNNVLVKKFIKQ